jgi:transcription elongation factor Elf1
MAKDKEVKEANKELTFLCKFCGESKPLSEMTFMTRYYPILIACRSCDIAIQSLKPEEPAAEETEAEAEEETAEETKE